MINKFYDSFKYLENHVIFNYILDGDVYISKFHECIDVSVVKVNPKTLVIEDNDKLNTKVQVWIEAGPYLNEGIRSHDIDLDCGADTFEEAIIELASLVKKFYTSDKKIALNKVKEKFL